MLTAREAADRLSCAPDYVGRLCRDGKLDCVRNESQWFVDGQSIFEFEKEREINKAIRSRALATERKVEKKEYQYKDRAGLRASLLAIGVSLSVGLLFLGSTLLAQPLSTGALSAALAQVNSPFFAGSGELPSLPNIGEWSKFFSGDVRLQVSVRKPSTVTATTTLVDAFVPAQPSEVQTIATSAPQIVINPVVEHTVERVIVENGISTALLSSIVKELAQGSDGSIQYSKGGSLAASSTALYWNDATGQLTVDGSLHAGTLCIEDTCLTKAQLQSLLQRTP